MFQDLDKTDDENELLMKIGSALDQGLISSQNDIGIESKDLDNLSEQSKDSIDRL